MLGLLRYSKCQYLLGERMYDTNPSDDIHSSQMVAKAKLTAHFVAVAVRAGIGRDEISDVLTKVRSERSFRNSESLTKTAGPPLRMSSASFEFPADPGVGTQAAPFAAFLGGSDAVVVQDLHERNGWGALQGRRRFGNRQAVDCLGWQLCLRDRQAPTFRVG